MSLREIFKKYVKANLKDTTDYCLYINAEIFNMYQARFLAEGKVEPDKTLEPHQIRLEVYGHDIDVNKETMNPAPVSEVSDKTEEVKELVKVSEERIECDNYLARIKKLKNI
jgi:hypothetical protein